MIKVVAVGVEACDQRTQAVGMAELGVDESHHVIPAGEGFGVGVAVEALDDSGEPPAINGLRRLVKMLLPTCMLGPFLCLDNWKSPIASVRPSMHRDISNLPRTALRDAGRG